MTRVVRRVPLLVTHLLLLPAGALLVWWWAQPVEPSRWTSELPSFLWPYMVALTVAPGVVAGVVEAQLLRRRHPVVGVGFGLLAGFIGLWLPLVYVTHGTGDVIPVETGDVVASVILWTLYWVGGIAALFATLHRARGSSA